MRWPRRNPALHADTSKITLDTSYGRAAKEWDNRIGSARVQARSWRLIALLSMLVTSTSVFGVVYLSVNQPFDFHIVEIDPKGQPTQMRFSSVTFKPSDAHVGYMLAELVELVRQRPLDPVVIRSNWQKAYRFLAGEAVEAMNAYAAKHSGLDTEHGVPLARMVQITSVLKRSNATYQVHWVETTFIGGVPGDERAFTGVFDIVIEAPKDDVDLFRNPLGLYVVHFQWSRDFSVDAALASPSAPSDQKPRGKKE